MPAYQLSWWFKSVFQIWASVFVPLLVSIRATTFQLAATRFKALGWRTNLHIREGNARSAHQIHDKRVRASHELHLEICGRPTTTAWELFQDYRTVEPPVGGSWALEVWIGVDLAFIRLFQKEGCPSISLSEIVSTQNYWKCISGNTTWLLHYHTVNEVISCISICTKKVGLTTKHTKRSKFL